MNKEAGITGFEMSQPFQKTHDVKIPKWLPSKDQTQGILNKTWSEDEVENVIIKAFVKTSEISQKMPRSPIDQTTVVPLSRLSTCPK